MKTKFHVLLAMVLFTAAGCSSSRTAAEKEGPVSPYTLRDVSLNVGAMAYHFSDDSTKVFFRFSSSELLYTRQSSDDVFTARVRVEYTLRPAIAGVLADTGSFVFATSEGYGKQVQLLADRSFAVKPGVYTLELRIDDMNHMSSRALALRLDKDDSVNSQNYLLMDDSLMEPRMFRTAAPTEIIRLRSDRNKGKEWQVFHYVNQVKLPPPPFASVTPEAPDPSLGEEAILQRHSDGSVSFKAAAGFYFITTDEAFQQGFTLVVASASYPEVATYDQLVAPLRFVTSKSEYDEITKSKFPKKLVDKFWVDCGGSKDKARDLIAGYYARVMEANLFFTTYTEGWRTDRGMIHLIFGPPTQVQRSADQEVWIYGDAGNPQSLSFIFIRQPSTFSDNVFVLRRDPLYKQLWDQMITAWRSGRVYLR
jgi:GWxTD domain-containing protein